MLSYAPSHLVIRSARPDDLAAITTLLDEAGIWLRSHAITDQWPHRFVPSRLTDHIDRGELHIAHQDNVPVGTFGLDYLADPEFWHDDPSGLHAGYLHRLTVSRAHAGRGIGARLIDHAAALVTQQDRRWLRLDCAKHNTRLHQFYRDLGFAHVRTVDVPHRKSGALFQRDAAAAPPPRTW